MPSQVELDPIPGESSADLVVASLPATSRRGKLTQFSFSNLLKIKSLGYIILLSDLIHNFAGSVLLIK
jgi:hypothetical protein